MAVQRKSIRGPFQVPGSQNWYVEIRGKRRSLRTTDKAEARKLIAEIKIRVEAAGPDATPAPVMPTWAQFKKSYLEWAEPVREDKTYQADKLALTTLGKHIPDTTPVNEIRPKAMDDMIAACLKRGNKHTTINCYIRHCKSAFSKLEPWHSIPSPFARAKQLKTTKKPPRFLTLPEVKSFLDAFEDQELRLLALGYLATGRRRNELLALKWADVDLEGGRYYIGKSKSHLARWYPISATFRVVLDQLPTDRATVFYPWRPDTVSHKIKEGLVAVGRGDMHLHDLRHTFASLFVQAGGSLRILQDLMGHAAISTTEIYAHMSKDVLSREVDRVVFDIEKEAV